MGFSRERSKVGYSHLFQNFPQFIMIHTVKGFGIVNKVSSPWPTGPHTSLPGCPLAHLLQLHCCVRALNIQAGSNHTLFLLPETLSPQMSASLLPLFLTTTYHKWCPIPSTSSPFLCSAKCLLYQDISSRRKGTVLFILYPQHWQQCLAHSLLLFSLSVMSDSLQPHGPQHARLPCPSPSPRVSSSSCPLCWWCHPTISSSVVPFSSYLQSFPASGSFLMSWFLHQVAKVLKLQHQSFQWIFRTDFL